MRSRFFLCFLLLLLPCLWSSSANAASQTSLPEAQKPMKTEAAMTPGMRITATTPVGKISITALDELTRAYTWEGATRSVEMTPRHERWNGSLGLYYPGPGEHWKEHKGITRAVVEEGQQRFKSVDEALKWIRERSYMPFVYRDDGLVVGWEKELSRRQLTVEVWQIFINGRKPKQLPGSRNQWIAVTKVPLNEPPLALAVRKNDVKTVLTLLAQGQDANVLTPSGAPVLAAAAKSGNAAIVEALLKNGAKPDTRDSEGQTALLRATEAGHLSVVQALLSNGATPDAGQDRGMMKGVTPLILAAMLGRTAIARALLEKGASVKAVDSSMQDTPLHWAATEGDAEIIRMLLERGAAVDARNRVGMTPLMAAAMGEKLDAVRLLVERGANVNARDDAVQRQYGMAQFTGDTATMKRIEDSGLLNKRHENGNSVLDWAQIGGNEKVITFLKEAGAKSGAELDNAPAK